jgi:hypothetical protein
MPAARNLAETLEARSIASLNGCVIWTGAKTPKGYGQIRVNYKCLQTHRATWELAHGPVPKGMQVLHKCDNPPCRELTHLFLGTAQDNSDDMKRKGRSPITRGGRNGKSKLTDAQVTAIRKRAKRETLRSLAAEFSIHPAHLSRIVSGKRR